MARIYLKNMESYRLAAAGVFGRDQEDAYIAQVRIYNMT